MSPGLRTAVVPGLQQVRGAGMPEGVAADRLREAGPSCRIPDRPLQRLLMDLVAHRSRGIRVLAALTHGKANCQPHEDAQRQTLVQPQTGTIEQTHHQTGRAGELS